MSGLFNSLSIGSQSLLANRQGIDTAAHNIANAQTEGYSRQRIEMSQHNPIDQNGIMIGNGVYVGSIKRSYDGFIEKQLRSIKSSYGESQSRFDAISELEAIYSPELSSTVSEEMDAFFGSLQTLANFPEELTARTSVREHGGNLASAFNRIDTEIRRVRGNLNEKLSGQSSDINNILKNLASLNVKISGMEAGSVSPANDLQDQRDNLVRKLSDFVNIHVYQDRYGMTTIRGPGDTLLLEADRAARLHLETDSQKDGMFRIYVMDSENTHKQEVTDSIKGGSMGGVLEIRDKIANTLLDRNNKMAQTFVDTFNGVHKQGFGLRVFAQNQGRDFFEPPADSRFAARDMKLSDFILNSTDAISAASVSMTAGDNIILNKLANLKFQKVFNDEDATFTEFYSNYVGNLGIEATRAHHVLESDKILEAEWSNRRESIAGVSLDEEATDLIRWQTAFTASSKVITTVDEMLETVLGLKR